MRKFIVGTQLLEQLYEAAVITEDPTTIRRIVIDLQANSPGVLYIEKYADDGQLVGALSAGIEVVERADQAGRPRVRGDAAGIVHQANEAAP